ncbi:MAG: hypothetical protein GC182_15805 [Rhodopseudomonas sp.]|nr:hypothetical protein [Rhodopseudomonas sp.]
MSFVVYIFVLLIGACSVLFGLDWTAAPMSPMPASHYELRAARQPSSAIAVATNPEPVTPSTAAPAAEPKPAARQAAAPPAAVVPVLPVAAPEPPSPKCDIAACEAAYRSFTSVDCTYQPNDGPRRLCTKGTPPTAAAQPAPRSSPDARAQATCNIAACTRAYISFTAADCTYQPSDGPRRLCTK